MILLILASHVAGVTGVHYCFHLLVEIGAGFLMNFLLGLASNYYPLDLLPSK
jgi:hypothetical protein